MRPRRRVAAAHGPSRALGGQAGRVSGRARSAVRCPCTDESRTGAGCGRTRHEVALGAGLGRCGMRTGAALTGAGARGATDGNVNGDRVWTAGRRTARGDAQRPGRAPPAALGERHGPRRESRDVDTAACHGPVTPRARPCKTRCVRHPGRPNRPRPTVGCGSRPADGPLRDDCQPGTVSLSGGGGVIAVSGPSANPSAVAFSGRRAVKVGQVLSLRPSGLLPRGLLARVVLVRYRSGRTTVSVRGWSRRSTSSPSRASPMCRWPSRVPARQRIGSSRRLTGDCGKSIGGSSRRIPDVHEHPHLRRMEHRVGVRQAHSGRSAPERRR